MSTQNKHKVKVHELGLVDYSFGINFQKNLVNHISKYENHMIFLEHNHRLQPNHKYQMQKVDD